MIETPPIPTGRQLSPDGTWEWNGSQWIPAQPASEPQLVAHAPAMAPAPVQTMPMPGAPARQLSPDGMWEWNGTQWIPAQPPGPQQVAQAVPIAHSSARPGQAPPAVQALPAKQVVMPPAQIPPGPRAKKGRRWPWIAGGLLGLIVVGAVISQANGGTNQPRAQSSPSPKSQVAVAPVQSQPSPPAQISTAPISTAPKASPSIAPSAVPSPAADVHALTVANVTNSIHDNQNFIFNDKFDNMTVAINGGAITVTVKPSTLWDETDTFKTGAADALVVAEATLNWYPASTRVHVVVQSDFTDINGNTTTEDATVIDLTKTTAAKLNYSGLRDRMESGEWWIMYYDSDGYYVHPAIWKHVSSSDQGQLLGSCFGESAYC